jgi:RHS repeat-associated protein
MEGSWSGIGSFSASYVGVDRLGSIPGGAKLFAWGDEVTVTGNDKIKFATYLRDGESGIDYGMNRYYGSGVGRFLTADWYWGSVKAGDPQSWNRYSYLSGDPINGSDPMGLCPVLEGGIGMGGPVSSNPAFNSLAKGIGADQAYPYSNGKWQDLEEVGYQGAFGSSNATEVAALGIAATQAEGGSETGIFYSGAATAASVAVNDVPGLGANLDYVVYLSPGFAPGVGPILGNVATYVFYNRFGIDVALGGGGLQELIEDSLVNPSVHIIPYSCGHTDFACIAQAAAPVIDAVKGTPCKHSVTITGTPRALHGVDWSDPQYLLELVTLESSIAASETGGDLSGTVVSDITGDVSVDMITTTITYPPATPQD